MMDRFAAHNENRTPAPEGLPMGVEGFWIVRVENPDFGEATGATLTLSKGHVVGGDDTYYYLGTYREAEDGALDVSLDATRFAGDPPPPLDDLSDMLFLRLTLRRSNGEELWHGEITDRTVEAPAPIRAEARRVAVLR